MFYNRSDMTENSHDMTAVIWDRWTGWNFVLQSIIRYMSTHHPIPVILYERTTLEQKVGNYRDQ